MKTIVGVFEKANANDVIDTLYKHGFDKSEVTFIDRERVIFGPVSSPDRPGANPQRGTAGPNSRQLMLRNDGFAMSSANLQGILSDLDIPDEETRFYKSAIRGGSALILVRVADDRAGAAETLLRNALVSNTAQQE